MKRSHGVLIVAVIMLIVAYVLYNNMAIQQANETRILIENRIAATAYWLRIGTPIPP